MNNIVLHSPMTSPDAALSPNGRYRVEFTPSTRVQNLLGPVFDVPLRKAHWGATPSTPVSHHNRAPEFSHRLRPARLRRNFGHSRASSRRKLAVFQERYKTIRQHWGLVPEEGGDIVTPFEVHTGQRQVKGMSHRLLNFEGRLSP